jgi:hypothetical protein
MIEDLLKQIEKALPEARPTLEEMRATYAAKGADYSQGGPSLANLRACEHVGVPAWKGALIRLSDKKQRIGSFVHRGTYAVAEEQVGDTLLDAASYAVLANILFAEAHPEAVEAQHQFHMLALRAIEARMLHHAGKPWDRFPWEQLERHFEALCAFARRSPK